MMSALIKPKDLVPRCSLRSKGCLAHNLGKFLDVLYYRPRREWKAASKNASSLWKRLFLYRLLRLARPYTMVFPPRLALLYSLSLKLSENQEGDYVECGTCRGGSAFMILAGIKKSPYRLFLFDTFKGLPEPTSHDGPRAREFTGACKGTIIEVRKILRKTVLQERRTIIISGRFQSTLRKNAPTKISLLHIDADWYASVLTCLRLLYPRVLPRGAIILDDYGHWEGARKALHKFFREKKINPRLYQVDYSGVYFYKA